MGKKGDRTQTTDQREANRCIAPGCKRQRLWANTVCAKHINGWPVKAAK